MSSLFTVAVDACLGVHSLCSKYIVLTSGTILELSNNHKAKLVTFSVSLAFLSLSSDLETKTQVVFTVELDIYIFSKLLRCYLILCYFLHLYKIPKN